MRLLFVLVVAVALAVPAAAAGAEVNPRNLVLRTSDLPKGFAVDKDGTGVQPNSEAASDRRSRAFLLRAGRVTGYEAEFDRGPASISSRADVFRTSAGARTMLRYVEYEIRKAGFARMRAARIQIGAEGWVWGIRAPVRFTIVVWRYRTVFAGVAADGIPRGAILALARAQQRRIAAALG